MNAGYCLHYIWSLRDKISRVAGFDILEAARILSTFHLEEHTSDLASVLYPSPRDRAVSAILGGLIQRGLPTFPSLLIERILIAPLLQERLAELAVPKVPSPTGVDSASVTYRLPKDFAAQAIWFALLARAHVPVDPRVNVQDKIAEPFGSDGEWAFYTQTLPSIAPGVWQLAECQRNLATIIGEFRRSETGDIFRRKGMAFARQGNEDAATLCDFTEQRVDFALAMPGDSLVLEYDGSQHGRDPQKALDALRDGATKKAGWSTLRVPSSHVSSPTHTADLRKRLLQSRFAQAAQANIESPLWTTPRGSLALHLILIPHAIARFQRILIHALETGALSLDQDQWRLAVIQRDVPFALPAIVDFCAQVRHLFALMGDSQPIPAIDLHVVDAGFNSAPHFALSRAEMMASRVTLRTSHIEDTPSDKPSADVLIDLSVLRRQGFTPMPDCLIHDYLAPAGRAYTIRSAYDVEDVRCISPHEPITYHMDDAAYEPLREFLRDIFRKSDFRPNQFEILQRTLSLQPVIGLLPTGSGKSLCFQLSALLQPGLCLVVDPIISLMQDQVDTLTSKSAIDWLATINSAMEKDAKDKGVSLGAYKKAIAERMASGRYRFLFMSPERLQSPDFRNELTRLVAKYSVPYAVIDEVHCVSEWGHDFRTSYLRLADKIRQYCSRNRSAPTFIALTGTASSAVLSDVQREIGLLDEQAKVQADSMDRPELSFYVLKAPSADKLRRLEQLLSGDIPRQFDGLDPADFHALKGEATHAGIVFTPYTGENHGVAGVAAVLERQLATKVGTYSSKIPLEIRQQVQDDFNRNRIALLVATKAFGMGIDKENVRYTIHYNISQSIESFYQEAGRAGRDRASAVCWIVFSDDEAELLDKALRPDASQQDISAAANARAGGDGSRLLFLMRKSYPGADAESKSILLLYEDDIADRLEASPASLPVTFSFPIGKRDEQAIDKALYRLSLLGVVSDYYQLYNQRQFNVTAVRRTDIELVDALKQYIARYKTEGDVARVDSEVHTRIDSTSVLKACVCYLVEFVYTEIEHRRRAALRTMVEVAREAAALPAGSTRQDNRIRSRMAGYLESSPFTGLLNELLAREDPAEWVPILAAEGDMGVPLLMTTEGANQLLNACLRARERNPEHGAFYFLASVARLLLPSPDMANALDEARYVFRRLHAQGQTSAIPQLLDNYRHALNSHPNMARVLQGLTATALESAPTRSLAHSLYTIAPEPAERVIYNVLLADLRTLNRRLTT